MHHSLIPSLAILKVNTDSGIDYLDGFVPFAQAAVQALGATPASIAEISAQLESDFGLRIPEGALRSILGRTTTRHAMVKTRDRYRIDKPGSPDFLLARDDAMRKFAALASGLVDFAASKLKLRWTADQASDALLSFLERHSADVLRAFIGGRTLSLPSSDTDNSDYAVAAFLVSILDSDPVRFEFVVTAVKGSMLAGALLFPDLSAVSRRFQDTTMLLDTRLLLQAMGWEGASASEPKVALLRLLLIIWCNDRRIRTHSRRNGLYTSVCFLIHDGPPNASPSVGPDGPVRHRFANEVERHRTSSCSPCGGLESTRRGSDSHSPV